MARRLRGGVPAGWVGVPRAGRRCCSRCWGGRAMLWGEWRRGLCFGFSRTRARRGQSGSGGSGSGGQQLFRGQAEPLDRRGNPRPASAFSPRSRRRQDPLPKNVQGRATHNVIASDPAGERLCDLFEAVLEPDRDLRPARSRPHPVRARHIRARSLPGPASRGAFHALLGHCLDGRFPLHGDPQVRRCGAPPGEDRRNEPCRSLDSGNPSELRAGLDAAVRLRP